MDHDAIYADLAGVCPASTDADAGRLADAWPAVVAGRPAISVAFLDNVGQHDEPGFRRLARVACVDHVRALLADGSCADRAPLIATLVDRWSIASIANQPSPPLTSLVADIVVLTRSALPDLAATVEYAALQLLQMQVGSAPTGFVLDVLEALPADLAVRYLANLSVAFVNEPRSPLHSTLAKAIDSRWIDALPPIVDVDPQGVAEIATFYLVASRSPDAAGDLLVRSGLWRTMCSKMASSDALLSCLRTGCSLSPYLCEYVARIPTALDALSADIERRERRLISASIVIVVALQLERPDRWMERGIALLDVFIREAMTSAGSLRLLMEATCRVKGFHDSPFGHRIRTLLSEISANGIEGEPSGADEDPVQRRSRSTLRTAIKKALSNGTKLE